MLNFHQSSLYWTDGDKTNNKCIKLSQHSVLFCLLLYIITVRIPDLHKFQLLRSKKKIKCNSSPKNIQNSTSTCTTLGSSNTNNSDVKLSRNDVKILEVPRLYEFRCSTVVWILDVPLLYEFRCLTAVWIQMFHCCMNLDVPLLYEFRCSTVVWIQMFHCCMNLDVQLLYEFRCSTVVWI